MADYNDEAFRKAFPEFANPAEYPEGVISNYFAMAQMFISSGDSPFNILNGSQLQLALNQMTAHLMMLGRQAMAAATDGTPEANQGGIETSASIDAISVQTMQPPVKGAWDYWLYQTAYGQMLLALLSVLAVGGMSYGGLPEREGFRKIGGVFF